MKTLLLLCPILFGFAIATNAQSVAINTTGEDPDSSAILDIQSSTKGVLIPRLDSVQRQMIANPAEGLLVYDMDTHSFWFRQDGQWTELVSKATGLSDEDNDTKLVVEQNPDDDTLRLMSGGIEFAKTGGKTLELGSTGGSVYIGKNSGTNANDSVSGNVAIGPGAGHNLTSGSVNTFIGDGAGYNSTTGQFSVGVGDSVLFNNTSVGRMTAFGHAAGMNSSDSLSTFVGYHAGKLADGTRGTYLGYTAGFNDQASSNTIIGAFAGNDTLTGGANTFVGKSAGSANKSGSSNTFLGESAGIVNTTGAGNTFLGRVAGRYNRSQSRNTYLGYFAGYGQSNPDSVGGQTNTAVGATAGRSLGTGERNTLIGDSAGFGMTGGIRNTIVGTAAGSGLKGGTRNTYVGDASAFYNVEGHRNVVLGQHAGLYMTEGNDNTLVGQAAALNLLKGSRNVIMGDSAVAFSDSISAIVAIGSKAGMYASGSASTHVGYEAGKFATKTGNSHFGYRAGYEDSGVYNTSVGFYAGADSLAGNYNTLIGNWAGRFMRSGGSNTIVGNNAGRDNQGSSNTFVGSTAGYLNNTGGGNVFIGVSAGRNNDTGGNNIFIGNSSGLNNQTGSFNTFVGRSTGAANISGIDNAFMGASAGGKLTDGRYNTFVGRTSGFNSDSVSYNTYLGGFSGYANETGESNTMLGFAAGYTQSTGDYNTVIGRSAMYYSDSSAYNTAVGSFAGIRNSTGNQNVFVGGSAGNNNATGSFNTYVGRSAGNGVDQDTSGNENTALGYQSGYQILDGEYNLFLGSRAGRENQTGSINTFVGAYSGYFNVDGERNTYLGTSAGYFATGSGNVFLGYRAGLNDTSDNKLYISNDSTSTPLVFGDFQDQYATVHGRLGINVKDPERELDIVDSDNDGDSAIKLYATNSSEREMLVGINQSSGGFISMETNNDLQMRTNGSVRVSVKNTGEVGIGTQSPTDAIANAKLNVAGGHTVVSNNYGFFSENSTNDGIGAGIDTRADDGMEFYTAGTSRGGITTSGKLGIGFMNPTEKITVQTGSVYADGLGGYDSNRGFLLGENNTGPAFGFVYNGAGSGSNNRAHIKEMLQGDTSIIMTFKGNGFVGINKSDPLLPLDVNGAIKGIELIYATEGTQTISMSTNAAEGYVKFDVGGTGHANDDIVIGDPNDPDNKVGIGTSSPTALLEVNSSVVKKVAGGTWTATSDVRLKKNITDYRAGLQDILSIRPIIFQYNDLSGYNTEERHIGVVAQELQSVAPYMVEEYEKDGEQYLEVDNSAMTYMLINAVKEQQELILKLEKRIAQLEQGEEHASVKD